MEATIEINTGAFSRFATLADASLADPDVRAGAESAQRAYLGAMRLRFESEGDGSWADLAPRTNRERVQQGFAPAHPILKRLGILENALSEGAPGNAFFATDNSIVAGYGGADDTIHPGYRNAPGSLRISEIAANQQFGIGAPARAILVQPDAETLGEMEVHLRRGFAAMIDRAVAGAANG